MKNSSILLRHLLQKRAAAVVRGGAPSRAIAKTLGRGPWSWLNLVLTSRALHSPDIKGRDKKYKELLEKLRKVKKEELDDVVVRLSGTDMVDDVLWKKDHEGKGLKWYQRIGGRVLQNPRSSLPFRLVNWLTHAPTYPIYSLFSSLARADHYSPAADAITMYSDEPVLAQHNLGHAIDYNRLAPKQPNGRAGLGGKLLRDLYNLSSIVPIMPIVQDVNANTASWDALRQAVKNKADLKQLEADRYMVLTPLIGSDVGGLAGLSAGKVIGLGMGDEARREAEKEKKKKTSR